MEYYKTEKEKKAMKRRVRRKKRVKKRLEAAARLEGKVQVKVQRSTNPPDLTKIVTTGLDPHLISPQQRKRRALSRKKAKLKRRKGLSLKQQYSLEALHQAIRRVESDIDKDDLMIHFVRRAYDSDAVLTALSKKLWPDLKSVDAKIAQKTPYKLILDIGNPSVKGLPSGD